MLMWWPFQSQYANDVLIEIFRLISSGSKSVVVEPSSTFPRRVTAPAANSMASTRDVLPTPPCPTTPTFRILPISIAISRPPWTERCGGADATTEGRRLLSPDRSLDPVQDLLLGARQIGGGPERRRVVLEAGAGKDQHDLGVPEGLAAVLQLGERRHERRRL